MVERLSHDTLGLVKGTAINNSVTQFLGLRYATLADRFAEPVLASPSEGTIDASVLGPMVLTDPNALPLEFSLIQQSLPTAHLNLRQSDLDGLNLNVTVPTSALKGESKLPVFAFIHGGGFAGGSATWPQYDYARIVELSVEKGMPMIAVGINYRLGAPGFLTSDELRKAGYKANNGLRDQRTALEWVKKHISGFGGDSDEVTVAGESAGGAAVTYLLQSADPLCKRIIPMSGSALLLKPVPFAVAEHFYDMTVNRLDITSTSPSDRITTLLNMPGEELMSKLGSAIPAAVVVDNEVVFGVPSFSAISEGGSPTSPFSMPGMERIESIMLGDCAFDGNIMSLAFAHRKAGIGSTFANTAHAHLAPDVADELVAIYGLDNPSTSDNDDVAFEKVLEFANDMGFYAPTLAYATRFDKEGKRVFVYRFNEPNLWPGPWKGKSSHILDITFLFQNYNHLLSDKQASAAVRFAETLISFVNGKAPFEAWRAEEMKALVLKDGKAEVKSDQPGLVGRNEAFVRLGERVGWDVLDGFWGALLRG